MISLFSFPAKPYGIACGIGIQPCLCLSGLTRRKGRSKQNASQRRLKEGKITLIFAIFCQEFLEENIEHLQAFTSLHAVCKFILSFPYFS